MVIKSTKYIENKPNHIFITLCHEGVMFAHMLVNGMNGEIEKVFYRKQYRKQKRNTHLKFRFQNHLKILLADKIFIFQIEQKHLNLQKVIIIL